MTLLIQQNQSGSDIAGRSSRGWVNSDMQPGHATTEMPAEGNLPSAAKRAEQLMDALEEELSMEVSVSYMRIETNVLFHVLLLIKKEDFLSSKIQEARLITERFIKASSSYDIRFSFAIDSENMMENIIKFNGYRLLHIR